MDFSKFYIQINNDLIWRLIMFFSIVSIIISSSDIAFAGGAGGNTAAQETVIGETLCRIVGVMQGSFAKALATIAIFVVGLGLLMGKSSWPVAAVTAVGVGILFKAPDLVAFLSGEQANSQCNTN